MGNKCQNIEKCSFFINYKDNAIVTKKRWVEDFCYNLTKSEECKRKIIKNKTGEAPPENMTPTGEMLN